MGNSRKIIITLVCGWLVIALFGGLLLASGTPTAATPASDASDSARVSPSDTPAENQLSTVPATKTAVDKDAVAVAAPAPASQEQTAWQAAVAEMQEQAQPRKSVDFNFPVKNRIDKILVKSWKADGIVPAKTISDTAFLRRATLDLIGVIPNGTQVRKFIDDENPNKRARLVDQLLKSPRYGQHWSVYFGDMLREKTRLKRGFKRDSFRDFIKTSLQNGKPYDKFVKEMITATGNSDENSGVGFVLRDEADPLELTAATTQVFLGIQLKCAQCHDHPFDDWKQTDFYGMAAFYSRMQVQKRDQDKFKKLMAEFRRRQKSGNSGKSKQTYTADAGSGTEDSKSMEAGSGTEEPSKKTTKKGKKKNKNSPEKIFADRRSVARASELEFHELRTKSRGELRMPKEGDRDKRPTGAIVYPKFLFGETTTIKPGEDRRAALARMIVAAPDKRFAKVAANRIWKQLLGMGVVDPVDDLSDGNPATNPELLEHLAEVLIRNKYKLRPLIAHIMKSSAYALSASGPVDKRTPDVTVEEQRDTFARARPRRMTGEQIFDSVLVAGGLDKLPGGRNMAEARARLSKRNKKDPQARAKARAMAQMFSRRGGLTNGSAGIPRPAPQGTFLHTFGGHSRESIYERAAEGTVPQALELMNGKLSQFTTTIRSFTPLGQSLIRREAPRTIGRSLYLSTLGRMPTAPELERAVRYVKGSSTPKEGWEDIQWSLINSHEFMFYP